MNAGQSLEDPLMRVSLGYVLNLLCCRERKGQSVLKYRLCTRLHTLGLFPKAHGEFVQIRVMVMKLAKKKERQPGHSRVSLFCQQEFTQSCLRQDPKHRPTAHDLLFHRVLFEVHSLKLLAAHCLINNQCEFLISSCRAANPSVPYKPSLNAHSVTSGLKPKLCSRHPRQRAFK